MFLGTPPSGCLFLAPEIVTAPRRFAADIFKVSLPVAKVCLTPRQGDMRIFMDCGPEEGDQSSGRRGQGGELTIIYEPEELL